MNSNSTIPAVILGVYVGAAATIGVYILINRIRDLETDSRRERVLLREQGWKLEQLQKSVIDPNRVEATDGHA